MTDPRPIGVFDSGVGGLTVLRALARELPHERLVYLGDTARVPYGPKSPVTVRRYAREASRFLRRQSIKLVVVACNTVSSVALQEVEEEAGVPVLGVILPGARSAVRLTRGGPVGVIGTRATVASEAYPRAIRALRSDVDVISRPCPLFVPLAEEGWTDNDVARQVAATYLEPLRTAGVDTLVLGCTHYPLLREVIAEVMGPGVALVDSAEAVAAEARERLGADPNGASGRDSAPVEAAEHDGAVRFWVTDAPEPFTDVAVRFLGGPVRHIERAVLEHD